MSAWNKKEISTWLSVPNRNKLLIIIGVMILVLLIPLIYRAIFVGGTLIGPESYDSLNLAKQPFTLNKISSYYLEPYVGERGWALLIVTAPVLLSKILPFLFGIASIILFYLIISKLKPKYAFISSLIFAISPATIYLFSTSTKYCAAIFLVLLAIYLYLRNRSWLALLATFVASFFSFLVALTLCFIYLFYNLYANKEQTKGWFLLFLFLTISFLIQFGYVLYYYGLPSLYFMIQFNLTTVISRLFTDFGAVFGFGVFGFILALFGAYFVFEKKYKYLVVYLIFFILLILSVFFGFIIYFLNFAVAFFVGAALFSFITLDWKLPIARSLIMLFIICGLLFSTISYAERFMNSYPNLDMVGAMHFLDKEGFKWVVLSDPDRAPFIVYGDNVALLSNDIIFYNSPEQRLNDLSWFYTQTNLQNTENILKQYDVVFVWVDDEMRNKIWAGTDDDVLFLIEHAFKNFFKAYSSESVDIWEYLKQ